MDMTEVRDRTYFFFPLLIDINESVLQNMHI